MNLTSVNFRQNKTWIINTQVVNLIMISLFFLCASCSNSEKTNIDNEESTDVIEVAEDDSAMNNAIAKAKATFNEFEAHIQEHGDNPQYNYSLKKPYTTSSDGVEHIWIADVKLVDGKYHGIIGNEPLDIPDIQLNQPVVIDGNEISDWMIMDSSGSSVQGGYTIRVLRDKMTEEERVEFDQYSGLNFE